MKDNSYSYLVGKTESRMHRDHHAHLDWYSKHFSPHSHQVDRNLAQSGNVSH